MTTKILFEYINYMTRCNIEKLVHKKHIKIWEKVIETMIWNRLYFNKNNDVFSEIKKDERVYIKKDIVGNAELEKALENTDINEIAESVIDLINNKFERTKSFVENTTNKIKIHSNDIEYRNLRFPLDERLKMLIKRTSVKKVLRMLLRYSTLSLSGQQCALPTNVYFYMYDHMNIKGEGYCSPLNSKLIAREGTKICSAFYDTDKYFGSLGPFNKSAFLKYNNINWTCNPPYLDHFMTPTIEAIISAFDEIENENLIISLVIPKQNRYEWLKESKYYVDSIEPDFGEHYMNCNGRPVHMNKTLNCIHFFSRNKSNIKQKDLEKLRELWNTYYEDTDNQSTFVKPIFINQ